MDPHLERSPGLALPQPSPEGGFDAAQSYQAPGHQNPEAAPSAPETNFQPAAPSFAAPVAGQGGAVTPSLPLPQPPAVSSQPAATSTSDDQDDLDQEWINKAKAIVEKTKTDPYIESREISKAKADYLRIRYNKHIKVAEERAQ
jgi:hypothetical protein